MSIVDSLGYCLEVVDNGGQGYWTKDFSLYHVNSINQFEDESGRSRNICTHIT